MTLEMICLLDYVLNGSATKMASEYSLQAAHSLQQELRLAQAIMKLLLA